MPQQLNPARKADLILPFIRAYRNFLRMCRRSVNVIFKMSYAQWKQPRLCLNYLWYRRLEKYTRYCLYWHKLKFHWEARYSFLSQMVGPFEVTRLIMIF